MTVSSSTTKNSYSGDGSTTVFAYGFKILDEDDITVILRNDTTGAETTQTITTHYTVSNVGNTNGGNITFVTAPTSSQTVVLIRSTPLTQVTDYTPNDPFPAAAHEDALDKLTFMAQELQEELDRSIKVSKTNTITSTEFTIGASDRANKIFAFDSSGDFAVTQEIGIFKGTDATTTTSAYKERDIIKSTTAAELNNVYICVADSVAGDLLTDTDHFELLIDAVSAATSATTATTKAAEAATSATNAATSESNASTSETNAATSATSAETAKTAAETAQTAAETAQTGAETAKTSAETAQTAAETAKTGAETAKTGAETAKTAAETAQTAAETAETNAATSETNAATSATTATTKASEAATSATSASTAKTAAETAKTAAETAQTAAETAQSAAETALDTFDDRFLGAKSTDPTVDNDGNALLDGALYFDTTNDIMKVYDLTNTQWRQLTLTSANQTNVNTVAGIASDVTAVAGDAADIGTVATDLSGSDNIGTVAGSIANVNSVGTNIANVNTTATNITGVNSFAERYRVGSSDPTTSLDEGDLAYNSTSNELKYYNGSSWNAISPGITQVSEDTSPSLGGVLSTSGNNVNFGDSDKAQFGAGNDLQIYHDGTQSIIHDSGTGPLRIRTPQFRVHNGAQTENIIVADENGAVTLYYDNASKIATTSTGVDVTGTVTADGLTVSGAGLFTGALSATPSGAGHVVSLSGNESRIRAYGATAGTGYLTIRTGGGGGSVDSEALRVTADGGVGIGTNSPDSGYKLDVHGNVVFGDGGGFDMNVNGTRWQFSVGGTERMRLDNNGRLGIGTTSPTSELHLHVSGANDGAQIKFDSDYGIGYVGQENNTSNNLIIGSNNAGVTFYASDTESMRLDSSGRLGIGTSSPGSYNASFDDLVIAGSSNHGITIASSSTGLGQIAFADGTTGDQQYRGLFRYDHNSDKFVLYTAGLNERLTVDSSGNVGIGTSSPASKFQVQGASTANNIEIGGNYIQSFNRGATPGYQALPIYASQFTFFTGGTERLRVTDFGNVGIGASSPNTTTKLEVNGDITVGWADKFIGAKFQDGSGFQLGMKFDTVGRTTKIVSETTDSNGEITFETNGSERMRVDTSGNLGIGTTSPSYLLDVSGHARINATSNPVLRFAETGTLRGLITSSSSIGLSLETQGALPLKINTNGAERMRITSGGLVGIGTSSPAYTLTVKGSSQAFYAHSTTSTNNYWTHGHHSSGDIAYLGAGAGAAISAGSATDYAIRANQGALIFGTGGNNERMRINSDGSWGKAPPGTVLQVVHSTHSTEVTHGSSYADTGLSASISPISTSSKILVMVHQHVYGTGSNGGGALRILRGTTAVYTDPIAYAFYPSSSTRTRIPLSYLDSPSTTSSTTYKTQGKMYSSGFRTQQAGNTSMITLIEVAG